MSKKELIGNQEHLPDKQYDYYPTKKNIKRAVLVHILGRGDCPKCWEELENHYTDGLKVFRKIPLVIPDN